MKAARRVRREDGIEEAPSIPSGHESGLNAVKRDGWIRRIDVASAIFKCILQDRLKYIQGDYPVAWAHWQRLAACPGAGAGPTKKNKTKKSLFGQVRCGCGG